ncbi:MAG: M23 family peptidase, partial [Alistipes sp.]|nr:M23 family peptidase [Alistipes sp.]
MAGKKDLIRLRRRKRLKQRAIRAVVHLLAGLGMAILYYIGFSFFFDTPVEYNMKHSTDALRREYEVLAARYDTLSSVLDNLAERDRGVFRTLFESEPYDLNTVDGTSQAASYEQIIGRSSRQLRRELRRRTDELEKRLAALNASYLDLQRRIDTVGRRIDNIPAIQPVLNKQLTLLTA